LTALIIFYSILSFSEGVSFTWSHLFCPLVATNADSYYLSSSLYVLLPDRIIDCQSRFLAVKLFNFLGRSSLWAKLLFRFVFALATLKPEIFDHRTIDTKEILQPS
jgi:inner membrane protein involved in colicin E2 resistance